MKKYAIIFILGTAVGLICFTPWTMSDDNSGPGSVDDREDTTFIREIDQDLDQDTTIRDRGVRVDSTEKSYKVHTECVMLKKGVGADVFAPTKSLTEWSSFKTAAASGSLAARNLMALRPCTTDNPCNNGVLNPGEQCDYGRDGNITTPPGNSNKRCTPVPGPGNSCSYCDLNCRLQTNYCGNGVFEPAREIPLTGLLEQCDDGAANGSACTPPDGGSCSYCSSRCQLLTLGSNCGDGSIQLPEQCDDGNPNPPFNVVGGRNGIACITPPCTYCSATCTTKTVNPSVCGDNVVNIDEDCDPGCSDCWASVSVRVCGSIKSTDGDTCFDTQGYNPGYTEPGMTGQQVVARFRQQGWLDRYDRFRVPIETVTALAPSLFNAADYSLISTCFSTSGINYVTDENGNNTCRNYVTECNICTIPRPGGRGPREDGSGEDSAGTDDGSDSGDGGDDGGGSGGGSGGGGGGGE